MRAAILAMTSLLALGACGDGDEPPASADLGAPVTWTLDPRTLSPTVDEPESLDAHRPREPSCPPATWGPEGGSFEVQTGACDYAAFATALPAPVQAGATLSVVLWHDLLDAEPSTAHVAVWATTDSIVGGW